ncbi:MAG: GNAT family N-acetyltransferase [candidate division Zixibacteria bacterium]|nr:GNAT family N-acetyltransferase [candidate division Zixibacteria bacterium]
MDQDAESFKRKPKMKIIHYTDDYKKRWNDFVMNSPEGSIYHLSGWRDVIEKSYSHKSYYLLAEDDGKLKGILPLFLVKSQIFGNSLVSLPFVDLAGLCSEGNLIQKQEISLHTPHPNPPKGEELPRFPPPLMGGGKGEGDYVNLFDSFAKVEMALLEEACKIASDEGVDYLELRQRNACNLNLKTKTDKVTLSLNLDDDPQKLWKKLPPERRNRIRKTEKLGLSTEFAGKEALDSFYRIFAVNMRDLGSPVHSRSFFKNILEEFPKNSQLILVKHDQNYIGAALGLFFKDTFTIPWVSSLRKYFSLYPNNSLYWEAMKFACSGGLKIFDFGRSSVGSGTFTFKVRWGAKPQPLYWQYQLFKKKKLPGLSADNPKYGTAIKLWKCLPVPITKLIGPKIRKYITA